MFYHIIMKNFKSNLKNYILFFVSNILAIAELFAFWGLNDVVKKAVKDGVTAATLKSDFVLAAGLITFITVFLMIFSMKYYMKLRIKDYTTFIVLGMKKKTSYLLLLVEYTVGCVFSLVFGILMGNGILYGAQTALHKLYPEFLKVTAPGWKIYRNTCGMSVANMTGVFLILLVWMDGRNLSTLISKSEYNEKRPVGKKWILFLMMALFISAFFVNGIKILSELSGYERRYEFLRCMGMKQKQRRKTIRLETQMLSDIALFATVMMGIVYVLSYEWRCASKDAGSLDVTFWMYWILIVGIYLLADRLVQWLFAQYVIKRVEKGND